MRKTTAPLLACASLVLGFALLTGCGVKAKDPQVGDNAIVQTDLPEGLHLSKNKNYLIRSSTSHLVSGEENTLTYRLVGQDLQPIDMSRVELKIEYDMPTMPQMGVFTAETRVLGPGQFEALYEISMGGLWETRLFVLENGSVTDEIRISYQVEH